MTAVTGEGKRTRVAVRLTFHSTDGILTLISNSMFLPEQLKTNYRFTQTSWTASRVFHPVMAVKIAKRFSYRILGNVNLFLLVNSLEVEVESHM